MELIKLVHKYINKYINSKELIEGLNNLDLDKYSKKQKEIIEKLVIDIKDITLIIPNEVDEIEKKRLENNNNLLEKFEKSLDAGVDDLDVKNLLEGLCEKLSKGNKVVRDAGDLYEKIVELLLDNSLVKETLNNISKEDMLDLITSYIASPMNPVLTQEEFNDLVEVGIKNDEREKIWRLASNYSGKGIDFSLIENYFILKRDSYYLGELVCIVEEDLDIKKLLLKVKETNDIKFINELFTDLKTYNILTDEGLENL